MNSPQTTTHPHFPDSALAAVFWTMASRIARYIRERREMRRERRRQRRAIQQLRGISDRTLRDIGIDRSEIASTVIHGREGR